MGKFRTRRNKANNIIIYIGLFIISIAFSINYLYKNELINKNTLLDVLISDNFNYNSSNITDVDFLFKYAFNMDLKEYEEVVNIEEDDGVVLETEEKSEPLIYIYNTHQEEKYKSDYLSAYNLSSTVLVASKILKEYLEDLGLSVIVEEESVADTLHSLNLSYGKSYQVSRMFMESALKNNPSLVYFVDLHRDSSVYDKTTTEIDGEKYAKILFVVGLDNEGYLNNLKLVEDLSNILKGYNESLYRGIMKKSGAGVNGVYNQDFSPNTMLIEVGGQYNSISEVNNTLKILANVLYDYIKGREDE